MTYQKLIYRKAQCAWLCLSLLACLTSAMAISPLAAATSNEARAKNLSLQDAASPYLRLHANDAVRWHVWGNEAFALAAKLNKPVMVSFGYTACHWCHVMQETHFNEPKIASFINEKFIPIIVDRERRPELDETYMLVTEALTRRGGWPNTVFLTPERKPFYGTAYIPADDFSQLLTAINDGWQNRKSDLQAEAARLSAVLKSYLNRQEATRQITSEVLATVASDLVDGFDKVAGGYGQGPKFFQQSILMFLLHQAERSRDAAALAAVELTLQAIISGGIHDHLAGGLHRYAVDRTWRIPHFEKMLYDQATMVFAYTEAYRITAKYEYGRMAAKIADYVLDDLTAPEGGFYATRDADSEGEEGTYYVWTPAQLKKVLGQKEAKYAQKIFGIVREGELAGKIVLNRDQLRTQSSPRAEKILQTLKRERQARIQPQRDEKIVVSWNGLMISALAHAGLVLGDEKYTDAALKAANFIWDNLRDKDGMLLRSYFNGRAEVAGELVDYAFLARSYVHLYDQTQNAVWLERANSLFQIMETRFADTKTGDFYASHGTQGFGRLKSRQDSDLASGNGVALGLLVDLAQRRGGPELARRSEKLISALSGIAVASPTSGTSILMAADRFLRGQKGPVQYGGGGTVRAHATIAEATGTIVIQFNVAKGWHINANKPLEDYLIATKAMLVTEPENSAAVEVSYPPAQIKQLGFSKKPLALWEGVFDINLVAKKSAVAPRTIRLEIQACSDDVCLEPDVMMLKISPPLPKG